MKVSNMVKGVPFVMIHVLALGLLLVPPSPSLVALGLGMYVVRCLGITLGYHRYFSHRAFRTGRGFQFFLALVGSTCLQRGVLWWASLHRYHHRNADTLDDVYSPTHKGFLWGYLMWAGEAEHQATRWDLVRDFSEFPELVWLNKYHFVPAALLGALTWYLGGAPAFFWGFVFSSILVMHAPCWINTFAHMYGSRRFETDDRSRNNWILGYALLGEGWHNNHHHDMNSAKFSRTFPEFDAGYAVLLGLRSVGIVWDLREPAAEALA